MRRFPQFSLRFLFTAVFVVAVVAASVGFLSVKASNQTKRFRSLQDQGILVHTEFRPPVWLPNFIGSSFRACFLKPKTALIHYEIEMTNQIKIGKDLLPVADAKIHFNKLVDIARASGFAHVTFSQVVNFDAGFSPSSIEAADILPDCSDGKNWFTPYAHYQELIKKNRLTFTTR